MSPRDSKANELCVSSTTLTSYPQLTDLNQTEAAK